MLGVRYTIIRLKIFRSQLLSRSRLEKILAELMNFPLSNSQRAIAFLTFQIRVCV
jgi:hypothetical protein